MPASSTPSEVLQCPTVEVLDGTASSRVYAGADQSNSNVKYQFSIGDVVRECSHVGDQLVLKVGVEGRVLIGPAGTPGTFAAPVRIAVRRDKDDKPVATKLYQIPVAIPGGRRPGAVLARGGRGRACRSQGARGRGLHDPGRIRRQGRRRRGGQSRARPAAGAGEPGRSSDAARPAARRLPSSSLRCATEYRRHAL